MGMSIVAKTSNVNTLANLLDITPLVSVILPTYNAAAYLSNAIDGILQQTYRNLELIIVNDGSSDQTATLLGAYTDPRITVIHQHNLGLPRALNAGIQIAKGKYIARQDADDVSLPERIAYQVAFMEQNSQFALLGAWTTIVSGNVGGNAFNPDQNERQHKHPTTNGELQVLLLVNNQFVHSTVMIRANCLQKTGIYSENPEDYPPEDYDLWLRIAQKYHIANLPKVLLKYLEVPDSISRTKAKVIEKRAQKMSLQAIQSLLSTANLQFDPKIIYTFIDVANGRLTATSISQSIQIQRLITIIKRVTILRFSNEKSEISKACYLLRKQTLKALIKSYLMRKSIRQS